MSASHDEVYSSPALYAMAFNYRNFAKECDFLAGVYREVTAGAPLGSFLELGAGPALHAIEMAARGVDAHALDIAPEMASFCGERARERGVAVPFHVADMARFHLDRRFDLAATLLDSFSYLLRTEDVIAHLACVAGVLRPGGIYLLELSHPADVFGQRTTTQTQWRIQNDEGTLEVRWGNPDARMDPLTQITEVEVALDFVSSQGVRQEVRDRAPQRAFTATELEALVAASGQFDCVTVLGRMDLPMAPIDNSASSWRMVPVLRRR